MSDARRVAVQLGIGVGLALAAGLVGLLVYEVFPPFTAFGVAFSGRFSLGGPLFLVFLVTGVWSVARERGEPHRLRHAWGLLAVYLATLFAVWHRVHGLNTALLALGSLVKSSTIHFTGLSAVIVWGSVVSGTACAIVAVVNGAIIVRRRRTRG